MLKKVLNILKIWINTVSDNICYRVDKNTIKRNAIKKNVARDKVVIASKVYFNEGRLSKKAIMREIDGSLKRLGTDYLDFT